MTLPSPVDQRQLYKDSYEEFRAYHPRARTLSMYSVSSGKSSSSSLSTTQSPYATPAAEVQLGHSAWGSFIPSTSATVSLRQFVSPTVKRTASVNGTRPRKGTNDDDSRSAYIQPTRTISSPPGMPAISRTPLPSPFLPGPPSGTSSSASSIHLDIQGRSSSDLHPVLARLERGSKLCGQMVCATCHKAGRDFPQCGKCKKMWCSRECRLVNGKRHKC